MVSSVEGGCFCGSIRYQFTGKPKIRTQCYCRNCQYFTAGGPQTLIMVPSDGFAVTQGEPQTFTLTADSDNQVVKHFCGNCATPLFSKVQGSDGMVSVAVGSLDDPNQFPPRSTIWTKSAPEWASINKDLPSYY